MPEQMKKAWMFLQDAQHGNRLVLPQEAQEILDAAHRFLTKIEGVIKGETQL